MPDNQETRDKIADHVFGLIRDLGLNPTDPNLAKTPQRVAKAYVDELCQGLFQPKPDIRVFPNDGYDEMVTVGPIAVKSLCSHHFLPFIGYCFVSYIPANRVIGLSKFSRIVNWHSRRPHIQEELTADIAEDIWERCEPKGCGVRVVAKHMCMSIRGVQEADAMMTTTALKGVYFDDPAARSEFLQECHSQMNRV